MNIHKKSLKLELPQGVMVSVDKGEPELAARIHWRWQNPGALFVDCDKSGYVAIKRAKLVGVINSLANVRPLATGEMAADWSGKPS